MSYKLGDVVLVPFPFTNQSGNKKRPAVVVSSTSYFQRYSDVVLMAVTSQIKKPLSVGEVEIIDWQSAGLLKPSVIKPVLTTIESKLILKKLGGLEHDDLQSLQNVLKLILG